MSNIPTPHIGCKDKNLIAKTVLMPGDPLRAKYIADNFLEDVIEFNHVRNMFGYTGYYKGKKISVMGSGMGMPSISIYAYELYKFYDVENIIRIGTCGAYTEDLKIFDTILVEKAYTDSNYASLFNLEDTHFKYPSASLNEKIKESAAELNIKLKDCVIHSSDLFYRMNDDYLKEVKSNGCKAVEMESFALFAISKSLNKKAACILSVSDSFVSKDIVLAEDRETKFNDMIRIALNTNI